MAREQARAVAAAAKKEEAALKQEKRARAAAAAEGAGAVSGDVGRALKPPEREAAAQAAPTYVPSKRPAGPSIDVQLEGTEKGMSAGREASAGGAGMRAADDSAAAEVAEAPQRTRKQSKILRKAKKADKDRLDIATKRVHVLLTLRRVGAASAPPLMPAVRVLAKSQTLFRPLALVPPA